ncbi:MAG: nucleoside deaminase [Firmicutes bacterium]|nr:nucleoside deaminase [Bacillota bacterium]
MNKDTFYMAAALEEAEQAFAKGEIPIGAVIVKDGEIIGRGHNLKETEKDPTLHAEIVAIRDAARNLGTWRLTGTTIYVTIEPCPMCAGALVQARIRRLVYGADDLKAGAVGSLWDIVRDPRLNHRLEVRRGVLENEAKELVQKFFTRLR